MARHGLSTSSDLKPTGSLGDIGNLGLPLPEAKPLLGHVQQLILAVQADEHAVLRPNCSGLIRKRRTT
jgi:hypothetical protein